MGSGAGANYRRGDKGRLLIGKGVKGDFASKGQRGLLCGAACGKRRNIGARASEGPGDRRKLQKEGVIGNPYGLAAFPPYLIYGGKGAGGAGQCYWAKSSWLKPFGQTAQGGGEEKVKIF